MTLPNYDTHPLAAPRIPYSTFLARLKTKNSPAVAQAEDIYNAFVLEGVDPSFALAQYRVESQYGTAGHAVVTKSWGNMLYDSSLCPHAVGQYAPGNGFTYAKYNDIYSAALDYINYLHNYAVARNLHTIYEVTAEWIGKTPGSPGHISYTDIVINDMIAYETKPNTFYEVGDKMIYGGTVRVGLKNVGPFFDKNTGKLLKKYPVTVGMQLYRGTDGTFLKKYQGTPGKAWMLGLVQGSTTWANICIGTSVADPDATFCYIKDVDITKIVSA